MQLLERARAELAARGADVPTVPCDITNKAQVDEMERTIRDRLGPIDVLINAGIIAVTNGDDARGLL